MTKVTLGPCLFHFFVKRERKLTKLITCCKCEVCVHRGRRKVALINKFSLDQGSATASCWKEPTVLSSLLVSSLKPRLSSESWRKTTSLHDPRPEGDTEDLTQCAFSPTLSQSCQ